MDKSPSLDSDEVVIAHELPSDDRNPNKRVLDQLYDMFDSLYDAHNLTDKRLAKEAEVSAVFRNEQLEINKKFEIERKTDINEYGRFLINLNESKLELKNTVDSFKATVRNSEANIERQLVNERQTLDNTCKFFLLIRFALVFILLIVISSANGSFIKIENLYNETKKLYSETERMYNETKCRAL